MLHIPCLIFQSRLYLFLQFSIFLFYCFFHLLWFFLLRSALWLHCGLYTHYPSVAPKENKCTSKVWKRWLKPYTSIRPPKKRECCTLEAADCCRKTPETQLLPQTRSPTCGDRAGRVMKESKHGGTCTISRRAGWGGSAHPLFSSSVPFFTFLFSSYSIYHPLRRLKYFITSRSVYSKLCLFWYQYQRSWRLLLSQLADLHWWPQGALFSSSVCNWRLKEKKNQPALMIKQAETVKMHHR